MLSGYMRVLTVESKHLVQSSRYTLSVGLGGCNSAASITWALVRYMSITYQVHLYACMTS